MNPYERARIIKFIDSMIKCTDAIPLENLQEHLALIKRYTEYIVINGSRIKALCVPHDYFS